MITGSVTTSGPGDRWFVDETYVKVAGRWAYLYRAVDHDGLTRAQPPTRPTRTVRNNATAPVTSPSVGSHLVSL
jgi:hypothetical protein